MHPKKTVIVVGAGASQEAGLPTSAELKISVNVPAARDGGVTGIMNPVVMNADKGAGNTERHALSSSAWRFATRILDQA